MAPTSTTVGVPLVRDYSRVPGVRVNEPPQRTDIYVMPPKPKTAPQKMAPNRAPAKKSAAKKTAPKATTAKTPARKAPVAKKVISKSAPSKGAPKKTTSKAPTKKATKTVARPAAKKVAPAHRPAPRRTPAAVPSGLLSRALRDLYATHRIGLTPIWDPATGLTVGIKVPASTTLHPTRTRCKNCRAAFGDLVVLRMFCSYRCALLPAPDTNPTTAPRSCKRAARSDEPGEWTLKQKFVTEQDAARYLRAGTVCYRCASCYFLHIGNWSPPPQQGLPAVQTGTDLFADAVGALLRARGESESNSAAHAAAKRDVRTVLQVIEAHRIARSK